MNYVRGCNPYIEYSSIIYLIKILSITPNWAQLWLFTHSCFYDVPTFCILSGNIWFQNNFKVLFPLSSSPILWRHFVLTVSEWLPQTLKWHGGHREQPKIYHLQGMEWQTPLWLMTLRTAWKVSRERLQEVAVNLRSHLSEMNMKGYIHNPVSEVKDFRNNH